MTRALFNPGHAPDGKPDPGAVNSELGLQEAIVVKEICDMAAGYVVAAGIEADVFQSDSLDEIVDKANSGNYDLFISVHCDSFVNPSANGTTGYCYEIGTDGFLLAACIKNQIVLSVSTTDRGVREANFYVLCHTEMPAVLIETAFISNNSDAKILASKDGRKIIAMAIARGVTDYFISKEANRNA